jgi:hypothetical protein
VLNVLTDDYVFEAYESGQRLLTRIEDLAPNEAKVSFREFLSIVDSRVEWWLRTAGLAGITWSVDSDEFLVAGWRVIKDGYADELERGRSGGMWIAFGFDWSVHASEVIRRRHGLQWALSKGKVSTRDYPMLVGFQYAHRTYGLSFPYGSQNYFGSVDFDLLCNEAGFVRNEPKR